MTPIRVLVVDDSAFARKVLRESLERAADIEVVGIAHDGEDALEKIRLLRPDVVTLDLLMPRLDGLAVLAALAGRALPKVLVVSTAQGDSELVVAALQAGAVDFIHKPTALATDRLHELAGELLAKVRLLAAVLVRQPLEAARPGLPPPPQAVLARRMVVIGTSTGGPQALGRLLPQLPETLAASVAVALHIPAGYTEALARRIDEHAAQRVVEATDRIGLVTGRVVIAKAGWHLKVEGRGQDCVGVLDSQPADTPHRPAVDVLFSSAARAWGPDTIGVVLTGMGSDGLEGARRVRAAGGVVITEAASSCVIDGMPRVVREAGLSTLDLPLDEVASALVGLVSQDAR